MSSPKEDEIQRFTAFVLELLSSETHLAAFSTTLCGIAAMRYPQLYEALKAEGKLPELVTDSSSSPLPPPPRFKDDEKNIMLFIERNKNKNVVVYRGMLTQRTAENDSTDGKNGKNTSGRGKEEIVSCADEAKSVESIVSGKGDTGASLLKMADKSPLDAFWLDIDPAYVEANRKKGIMTNRCELNFIDRNMAYGVTVKTDEVVSDLQKAISQAITRSGIGPNKFVFADPRIFPVSFVAVPSRVFFQSLVFVSTGCQAVPHVYLPIVFTFVDGKLCVAERIYVEAKERGLMSLPKVQHVDIFGWEISSANSNAAGRLTMVTERLKA